MMQVLLFMQVLVEGNGPSVSQFIMRSVWLGRDRDRWDRFQVLVSIFFIFITAENNENWYLYLKSTSHQIISTNMMKSGYEGQYLSWWKLVVFDGLTLTNKLTIIIFFFNTIHIRRSIKITDNHPDELIKITDNHPVFDQSRGV